jgi:hypothetical protein
LDKTQEQLIRLFRSWQSSLEKYIEQKIGVNPSNDLSMTTQQRMAAREVSNLVNAKRKKILGKPLTEEEEAYTKLLGVSIMSGQGTGKDAFTSWVIDWWLTCFKNTLIPCTAPTADQIKNILWSEFSRWYNKTRLDGTPMNPFKTADGLGDNLVVESQKIWVREKGGKECFAFWKTANPKDDSESQAGTLYGFHAPNMLIVVDEAASVPEPVFTPLEGTITEAKEGVNWILLIFNPIYNTGFAVNTHRGKEANKWLRIHWDAEDSERVSKQHIQDMEDKYGRESNTFRTLVKGLPPHAEEDALIPLDWVMAAVDRDIIPMDDDPLILGVDVGAGGDNSVACLRRGGKVYPLRKHSSPDTMALVGWLAEIIENEGVDVVYVDVIGIGKGVYDRMRELGYRVFAVDSRRALTDDERFNNVREKMWWSLREVFEQGTISIPDNLDLKEQLWSPRFKHSSGRKISIESKYEMRRRIGFKNSPNEADALGLTLYMKDTAFRQNLRNRDPYATDDERARIGDKAWMAA